METKNIIKNLTVLSPRKINPKVFDNFKTISLFTNASEILEYLL